MKVSAFFLRLSVAGSLLLTLAAPAGAHFLWLRMPDGSGSALRVTFGEEPADATTPDLLAKIQKARAWTPDGKTLETRSGDGALTADVSAATPILGAEQVWGVLDRRDQGRGLFLLRYYAKTARSDGDAMQSAGLPVEVFAKKEDSLYLVTVKEGGKPAPGAEVWVQNPGEAAPLELKTDPAGEVRFPVSGSGTCGIRAMIADLQPGKLGDQSYDLARNYSTLTFPVKADAPDAAALLATARNMRERWDRDFPGFSGQLRMEEDGKTSEGTVKVASDGGVEMTLDAPDFEKEAKENLQSLVMHRLTLAPERDLPSFGSEEVNPQGRAILLNDSFGSMYRIRDGQIMQVNRKAGDSKFSIDILRNTVLDNGKYLPSSFTVAYRNAATGALNRVEGYSERYEKTGAYWLPAERRIVTTEGDETRITTLHFLNLRLNPSKPKTDDE